MSPDSGSQGPRFESRRGTNVLWQDIHLHLPHLNPGEVNGYLVGLFLEMHCALNMAAES